MLDHKESNATHINMTNAPVTRDSPKLLTISLIFILQVT